MSRFEEVVNEAIDDVVLGEAFRAGDARRHIAERVRERQGGLRAEVTIGARYPETSPRRSRGMRTQELYTLSGPPSRPSAEPHAHRASGARA